MEKSYDEVMALPRPKHEKPLRPNMFFRTLVKMVSDPELKKVQFSYDKVGMEAVDQDAPCLYLMNHSSSIDLKIASRILYPKPYNIVCTSDGFIDKYWLMRQIGCIPTRKFVTDLTLIKDMIYALKDLKTSVLMYPEASYTFDGTATPLPESLGKCIKTLKVPVVMIRTFGAFQRDPLYNNLQVRDTKVTAREELLLSAEQIEGMPVTEINQVLKNAFSFDQFRWQQEEKVVIAEPFRADYLNRVLYKCPHCQQEGQMEGKATKIRCHACTKEYMLTEYGALEAVSGEAAFTHVPDWFAWERECVKQEILDGNYGFQTEVDIYMMVDYKAIYHVGNGTLCHNPEGFTLDGCEGKLHYEQKPTANYSLYSDYYWYELGDMICIGTNEILYYCFPKNAGDIVAKARIAAEELYKAAKMKR